MEITAKVTVPEYVYRFYMQASRHIANCTAENIMADALSAYAGLLSDDIQKIRESALSDSD